MYYYFRTGRGQFHEVPIIVNTDSVIKDTIIPHLRFYHENIDRFVCLFVYLFVYLFICLFVYLFICLFVYLFICLFVHLFICLFVCLLIYLLILFNEGLYVLM